MSLTERIPNRDAPCATLKTSLAKRAEERSPERHEINRKRGTPYTSSTRATRDRSCLCPGQDAGGPKDHGHLVISSERAGRQTDQTERYVRVHNQKSPDATQRYTGPRARAGKKQKQQNLRHRVVKNFWHPTLRGIPMH